jgi:hypothetical protein
MKHIKSLCAQNTISEMLTQVVVDMYHSALKGKGRKAGAQLLCKLTIHTATQQD